ncbi:hypothetical protein [Propioniciclava flava]
MLNSLRDFSAFFPTTGLSGLGVPLEPADGVGVAGALGAAVLGAGCGVPAGAAVSPAPGVAVADA